MFWELYQQSKIRDAGASASRAESQAQQVRYTIAHLEAKIDALALTCQALWEIARDQSGLTDEQLLAKVNEIDLRDGQADGKFEPAAKPCAKCGRVLSKRHMSCLYCGASVEEQNSPQP